MRKPIAIKTNVKYNELQDYKRRFENHEISEMTFQMYIDNIAFSPILKYGLVRKRLKYDRRYKFKIYLDGLAKKGTEIKAIQKLYKARPSEPLLMLEILFAKERQELIELDNGDLAYHFTFLQY